MPVIKPFREKIAASTTELTFTPPAGRAAIVTDIICLTPNAGWATVKSANATVGYFEIGTTERNHLAIARWVSFEKSTLKQLAEKGLPTEFPVPEGEKFVISTNTTCDFIIARYKEVDTDDVKQDMPNTKTGKEALRIFYGTNDADITSSGWVRLRKSLNPPEMHNWPFEDVANPFDQVEIHGIGILCLQRNDYDGTNDILSQTERTRIWRGTEVIIHPDEDGFVTYGGGASAGSVNTMYAIGENELPYTPNPQWGDLFMFDEPLVIEKGEELAVEIYCTIGSGGKIPAGELRCALFSKAIRG